MTEHLFLSEKGKKASSTLARVDLDVYFEALENRYHPVDNPSGALPMSVAENQLCWDNLKQKFQQITRKQDIPDWVASYGDAAGVASFREAIASFFSEFLFGCPVNPESLACFGGATGVIEMTAFLLANPGDTAVIPAPSYPVYTGDLGVIPGVKRYDLHTHHELEEIQNEISISLEKLEKTKNEIEAQGSRFKLLILTSPDNPTGMIYSEAQLRSIADWCIAEEIHLIVNEIYGLSRFNLDHPQLRESYPDPIPFYSFGKLMHEYQSPLLHHWYSFSKDFGISGFRIGVIHSHNSGLIQGSRNAGLSHSISNYTQWVVQEMLSDHDFLEEFFQKHTHRLTEAFLTVKKAMDEVGTPIQPAYGSLFAWVDFSAFLKEESHEGETDLWLEIFEKTGVLLTPTDGFGHSKKGLFRLVITSLSPNELKLAMERLQEFFKNKK
ncbi:aminotransferase class I/II-fold pyridoxal phosphate-dependent enzyme [Algoriphagus namhaensis]|uniref:Aminotransferase n=1 Tax=Algoriphagus namhaensis TaxID=915353 RepID=A0ABV8ALQ8_9BACT